MGRGDTTSESGDSDDAEDAEDDEETQVQNILRNIRQAMVICHVR